MLNGKIFKVFVSSTYEDLRQERAAVQKALLELNCLPVGMELFPAADDEAWDFIKKQIASSDYYIVIVAGRYGSLASDGLSYTEKEFDYARSLGLPSIGFVHGNPGSIPLSKADKDPSHKPKLDAFIEKVRGRLVRFFESPDSLASVVTTSFVNLMATKPAVGFVRADSAVDYKKYVDLLERNTELEAALKQAQGKQSELALDMFSDGLQIARNEPSPGSFRVSLGDFFTALAESTLDNQEESYVKSSTMKTLVKRHSDWDIRGVSNNPIEDEVWRKIKALFYAAGVIDVSRGTRNYYDIFDKTNQTHDTQVIKVTDFGRTQLSALAAQRIKSISPKSNEMEE